MQKDVVIPPDTDRLAFRVWHDDDLDRFHAICRNPLVMQYVGDGRVWSPERTAKFIRSAAETLRHSGYCQWPVICKEDDQLIGYCGFANTDNAIEIGWRFGQHYWGQGLATEAADSVLRFGTETLGFQQVVATVQIANTASIRVVEKLGMVRVKQFNRSGRALFLYSTPCGQ